MRAYLVSQASFCFCILWAGVQPAEAQHEGVDADILRCVGAAHLRMEGRYEVEGTALSESGDLKPIFSFVRVEVSDRNNITFYTDEQKFGRWWLDGGGRYFFETFDDQGVPSERTPVSIESCRVTSEDVIVLERRWISASEGKLWNFSQISRILQDGFSETTLVASGEEASLPITVNDVVFTREGS